MTPAPLPTLRLLVADDIALNQKVIAAMLKRLGHGGVIVSDGEQALRAMEQQRFDAVLLDASMPVLDGLGTLREIRETERRGRARTPVIMITGHDSPDDRNNFLRAGANGFVPKPIQIEELLSELRRVLRL